MATDTSRGKVFLFEDFVGWDIMADKPEFAVDTDPAIEIVSGSGGQDGVARFTMDAGQTNIGGILFGQTQWDISQGPLIMEARVKLSAIGTADERVGMWLTDLQEDTLSEYPFTIATTVATAVADPNDAIGIFWEGNATNASWYPLSQKTDSLVIDGVTNVAAGDRVGPTADEWQVLKMVIYPGATVCEFFVDGKLLYRYEGAAAIADVPLIPVIGVTEGTTAINFDVDYVYIEKPRAS